MSAHDDRTHGRPTRFFCLAGFLLFGILACAELPDLRDLRYPTVAGQAASVNAVHVSDSTVYIGGTFNSISHARPNLGIFDVRKGGADGRAVVPNGAVHAIVPDGEGGWFVGGSFHEVGGLTRGNLVHIKADGGVDVPWVANVSNTVRVLALSEDKQILYIGGDFQGPNSVTTEQRDYVAAVNAATGAVMTWNPAPNGAVRAIVPVGSKVYLGGAFTLVDGDIERNGVARVGDAASGGHVVDEFDPQCIGGAVNAIAVRPDGEVVYLAGDFRTVKGGAVRNRIAAFGTGGGATLLPWNPDCDGLIYDIVLSGDGKFLFVGGQFSRIGGSSHEGLASLLLTLDKYNAGPLDMDVDDGDAVFDLELMGEKLFVAGNFSYIGSAGPSYMAQIDTRGGSSLTDWIAGPAGVVNAVAVGGSQVAVGGSFSSVSVLTRNNAAAFDLQSGAVRNWNPDLDGPVLAITSRNDGPPTIYLGGSFANANVAVNSQGRSAICAVDSSGSLTAWNPGSDNRVLALAYHNGKVYAGGEFTNIGGQGSNAAVEALDADTDTDNADTTDFNPSLSAASGFSVYALRLSDDLTHIFVGGNFTVPTANIAKIDLENGDGAVDWETATNGAVKAIEIVESDVFFGGPFTQVTDLFQRPEANYIGGLAKVTYMHDAGKYILDTSYNPNTPTDPDLSVLALAGGDAGLFVGGNFSYLGSKRNLALVDPAGNVVSTFNALQDAEENVFALAFADNVLLTGGAMTGAIEGRVRVKLDPWDNLVRDGFGSTDRIGVTSFAVHQGELFAAVETSTTPELRQSPDGETWNPAAFTFNPVLGESNGQSSALITDMLTFNGFFWITISTGEIYRLSGSTFRQINDSDSGFILQGSINATVMEIHNDFLYVGTRHSDGATDGAQLWRTRHDRLDADYDAGGAQDWEKVADLDDDEQFPGIKSDSDLEITALYSDGTDLFFGTANPTYGSTVYSSTTGDVGSWSKVGDSHNDGSFEGEFNAGSGNFSAVRYTASSSGEDIVGLDWYQFGSGGAFYVKVFEDDGGRPGAEIYSAVVASNLIDGWNTKDLSSEGLNVSGDFWIGTKEFSSSKPFGLDSSSDSGNSYRREGIDGDWTSVSGNLGYRVFLDCGDNCDTANTAVTSMNSINGILFAGTRNDNGAELHWFDGRSWNVTGGAGLGDNDNKEINHLTFGQNFLWATTVNRYGAQVLRSTDGFSWTVSTKGGFAVSGTKSGLPDLIEFNEAIYWGGENAELGAQVYRLHQPTVVEFSQAAFSFQEGATPAIASIQVERSGELNVKTTVEFNLADCGASIDKDYSGFGGTITWLPGDTAAYNLQIPIADDLIEESTESIVFNLSNPFCAVLGTNDSAVLNIQDDDAPALHRWKFEGSEGTYGASNSDSGTGADDLDFYSISAGLVGPPAPLDGGSGSLLLNGADGYVAVRGSDASELTESVTVSVWFCRASGSSSSNRVLVDTRSSAPINGFKLELDGSANMKFSVVVDGVVQSVTSETIQEPDLWHHVAGVYDDNEGKLLLYINGQLYGSETLSGSGNLGSSNDVLRIGADTTLPDPSAPSYFDGKIDEVTIYDYVLTPRQIKHYSGVHITVGDVVDQVISGAAAGDRFVVGPGTYTESITFPYADITLCSNLGPAVTVLDGGGLRRVVTIDQGQSSATVLQGFKITNGYADENDQKGGGLYVDFGSGATVNNCIIGGNSSYDGGAGVYVGDQAGGALLMLNNCQVLSNRILTNGHGGGGLANGGSLVLINDCLFTDNTAMGETSVGGGILTGYKATTVINRSFITGNGAANGAGIGTLSGEDEGGRVIMVNSVVAGNLATVAGGALYGMGNGSIVTNNTIMNNTVSGGTDTGKPGGLFYDNPSGDDGVFYNNIFTLNGDPTYTNSGNPLFQFNYIEDADDVTNIYDPVYGPQFVAPDISDISEPDGVWSGHSQDIPACRTTLEDSRADYTPNELCGKFVAIAIGKVELYWIVSNTRTEVVIAGIIADPGLAGYKFFDFRLRGGVPGLSMAVDAGTTMAPCLPTVDITSQPRIGSIDMGAYEFVDTDADGIADWWEEKFGFDPLVANADLDPDSDTFSNLFEYAGNASPVNAADVPGSLLFVDCTNGDDALGSGAAASPFQSITRALATANPGQIIEVAPGEYLAGNLMYNAADDTHLIGPEPTEDAVATSYLGEAVYIDDDGISGFTAGDSMWVDSTTDGQYDEVTEIELNGSPLPGEDKTGIAKNVVFIDYNNDGIDANDSTWIDRGGLIPRVSVYVTGASGAEATIIDAQESGRAIVFENGEDRNCIFNGFSLRNGDMTGGQGGAVYCVNNSDPVFINCSFKDNVADFGGAVYAESSPRFTNCTFDTNQANFGGAVEFSTSTCHAIVERCTVRNNRGDDMAGGGGGGGFKIAGIADVRIENTEFYRNKAIEDGGAIMVVNATTSILNCTIVENDASNGRALHGDTAAVTIYNSILYTADGDGSEISEMSDSVTIDFCIVRGGFAGPGAGSQISTADPQFIDVLNDNFELNEGSPAIDQADIETALQFDKRARQRIDDLSVVNGASAGGLPADLGAFERSVLFVDIGFPGNDGNDGTSGSPLLTIQEALGRAMGGTHVIVAQGVYGGAGNFDLDFLGKTLTLTAKDGPALTIIDASGGRGAWFREGERAQTVFEGFTITNGSINGVDGIHGGGILCSNSSSPTLRNLRICDNETLGSGFGGGIACIESSHPYIETCTIAVNNGAMGGGGIYLNKSSPVIDACRIIGNLANTHAGGGILAADSVAIIKNSAIGVNVIGGGDKLGGGIAATNGSMLKITNCTIAYNDTQGGAGAELYTDATSPVEMYNTILWDPEYATNVDLLDDNATSSIDYCNVPGEALSGNNISQDPLLIRNGEPGTWSAAVPSGFITTLTRDSGTWVPDELVGIVVNPNSAQSRGFPVMSNDSTSLTVWGDATAIVGTTDTSGYKLYDGRLMAESPCIDMANAAVAPTFDFEFEARYTAPPIDSGQGMQESMSTSIVDIGCDEHVPPTVKFETLGSSAPEAISPTINLRLNKPWYLAINVDINTSDVSATTADNDYTAVVDGVVNFLPYETLKGTVINVNDDPLLEADEKFSVSFTNESQTNTALRGSIFTIEHTITNDDTVNVNISAPTQMEVAQSEDSSESYASASREEDTTPFIFDVTLTGPVAFPVHVDYFTSDGTATSDSDYRSGASTLIFNPGTTRLTVVILVNNDDVNEVDESFSITLDNLQPADPNLLLGVSSAAATILNDDIAMLDFEGAWVGLEDIDDALFTVTLDKPTEQNVTIQYRTVDGTARSGSDYETASGVLAFGPGVTAATFTAVVKGDTINECDEAFTVVLSNPFGQDVSFGAPAVATIFDDDFVQMSATAPAAGAEGSSFVFTVTLDTASQQTLTVDYMAISGTAAAGADFLPASDTLTFNPGVTLLTVTVPSIGDAVNECDETFSLDLTNPTGLSCGSVSIGPDSIATATIIDDDAVQVSVTAPAAAAEESSFVFTVTLDKASDQMVTIDYTTTDGSATSAGDYMATSDTLTFNPGVTSRMVLVSSTGDTVNECDETFSLDLANPTGVSCASVSISESSATATIIDDDAVQVSVTAPAAAAEESSFVFTVTLDTVSTQTVTVDYTTSNGTATSPSDYTSADGTLTFNPGVTALMVLVSSTGDTVNECDETFSLDLTNPTGLSCDSVLIGPESTATATINDDDAVLVSVTAPAAAAEGSSFVFTVTLDRVSQQTVAVDYMTSDGTAAEGADYTAADGKLTFNPGVTLLTVTVASTGDAVNECVEEFSLDLANPTGLSCDSVSVGPDSTATATIIDDDPVDISVSQPPAVLEGEPLIFHVTMDRPSQQTVTVTYNTADGSATTGSNDYIGASAALMVFAPGTTVMSVSFTTLSDNEIECQEDFLLSLTNPVGCPTLNIAGGGGPVFGLINEAGQVQINISGSAPRPEGDRFVFTVTLDQVHSQTVAVDYGTTDGTAKSGEDYTAIADTLIFAAGTTSQTVGVDTIDDLRSECPEMFTVELTMPDGPPCGNVGLGGVAHASADINDNDVSQFEISPPPPVPEDGQLVFGVTVDKSSQQSIRVSYATSGGTAAPDLDYEPTAGTLTFDPGITYMTLRVHALDDAVNECTENFQVTLSDPIGACGGVGLGVMSNALGLIDDGDPVEITVSDPPNAIEGSSFVFSVTLDRQSQQTVRVNYNTRDGSASMVDYADAAGLLTFAPGTTVVTVRVGTMPDSVAECPEDFFLDLTSPDTACPIAVLAPDAATARAVIDDSAGVVQMTLIGPVPASEGDRVVFAVTLDRESSQTLQVEYGSRDGSAVASQDYTAVSNVLTFSAGTTKLTIGVETVEDEISECIESFHIDLTNPSGAICNNATLNVATASSLVNDNDTSKFSLATAMTVVEGGRLVFAVTMDKASDQTVQVNYATSDETAESGMDYGATFGTLEFSPGTTWLTVGIPTLDDAVNECPEAVRLMLSVHGSGCVAAGLGMPETVTGMIDDNDTPKLQVHSLGSVTEGNAAVFSVSLDMVSQQSITVAYNTMDDSATSPADYSAAGDVLTFLPGTTMMTVAIGTNPDAVAECGEQFTFELTTPTALCPPVHLDVASASGIIDDAGFVRVDVSAAPTVNEGDRVVFGIQLDTVSSQTVEVDYTTRDESTFSDEDYMVVSGRLTFSPGVTRLTIGVGVLDDEWNECTESFILELGNPDGVECGNVILGGSDQAPVDILDNDPVNVAIAPVLPVAEGQDLVFEVTIDRQSQQSIRINYTTQQGQAQSGNDYEHTEGVEVFLPGVTKLTIPVGTHIDGINECNEDLQLRVDGANGVQCTGVIDTTVQRLGTIEDNDPVVISVDDAPAVTEETGPMSTLHFVVTLEKPSIHEISVQYNTDHGSATTNDYQAVPSGMLTFAPGSTRTSLDVVVFDDAINECDEEMFVKLHSPSAPCPVEIADSEGVGTIEDDDEPLFVTCPEDLVVSADADFCDAVVDLPVPEVADDCGVSITLDLPFDSSAAFPIGTTSVSYIAEDEHGQMAVCNFLVTVEDDDAPMVTCPGNVIIACGLGTDPGQAGTATATDNCDFAPIISHTDDVDPPDCTEEKTVVRTWTAIDADGNAASCQQNIYLVLAIGWLGDASGDFDDPVNWEGGIVPGAATNVVITAVDSLTVTLTNPTSLASLTIGGPAAAREEIVHTLIVEDDLVLLGDSVIGETGVLVIRDGANVRTEGTLIVSGQVVIENGSLTCLDTATIDGILNWSNGSISGAGPIVLNGEANLQDDFEKILSGPLLELDGVANWTDGDVTLDAGAVIDIGPDGVLSVTADGKRMFAVSEEIGRSSDGSMNNEGEINSNVPNDVMLNLPIDHQGIISVHGGDLQIFEIINQGSGLMTVAAGASLSFDGGLHQLGDPRKIQGAGSVRFLGGVSNFESDQTVDEDTPTSIVVAEPPLFVSSINDPANGIAVDEGAGLVTYTPDSDFNGNDDIYGELNGAAGVALFAIRVTVNPISDPPIAVPGGPYVGEIGGVVELDGTASFDPDNEDPFPTRTSWSFDGITDHVTEITHDLDLGGSFSTEFEGPADPDTGLPTNTISLTVEDNEGNQDTVTTTLTIYDNRPFADATANPSSAACHQTITFDASSSRHGHPGHSIVHYEWDFGDGSALSTSVPTATHAYASFGTFTVTVSVIDDNASPRMDQMTLDVDVNLGNHPPVADAGDPYETDTDLSLTLTGLNSSDPDEPCTDAIVQFEWDLDNDGEFDDAIGSEVTLEPQDFIDFSLNVVDDPGAGLPENIIGLRVTDTFGATQDGTTNLRIFDNNPFPEFIADSLHCDTPVIFDGTGSFHGRPDRIIVQWEWDFDYDGEIFNIDATGPITEHTYNGFGLHDVALRVTDNNVPPRQEIEIQPVDLTGSNRDPLADAGGPYDVDFGSSITFDGSQSSDPDEPCGDGIMRYEWDLNGNGQFVDSSNANPVLTWNQLMALGWGDGETRTIRLRVFDGSNAFGSDSTQLTIGSNGPPTARAGGPYQFSEGTPVNLDASGSTDPENGVLTFEWAVAGNILPLPSADPSPILDWVMLVDAGTYDPGEYSGQLTVTDEGGAMHTNSFSLTIDNLPPLVTLPPDLSIFDGDNVTVSSPDMSATIDDVSLDKGRHTFSIDWGDSTSSDSGTLTGPLFLPDVTHTYDQNGIFSLFLTVTDLGGESRTAMSTVTVQNHDPDVVITPSSVGNAIPEGSTLLFGLNPSSVSGEFHVQFNDLSPQDTHTAIIDWGDGLVQSVAVDQENDVVLASHLFGSDGSYAIDVTVTDLNGGTTTATTEVVVTPAALSRQWTNSTGDRNWANPLNWNPAGVPDNTDSVVFEGPIDGPIVGDTFELQRLTLASDFSGVFGIASSGILTVGTVTTINGGTFNLDGVLRIGGNLLIGPEINGFLNTGTIDFFGGTPELPVVISDLFGTNLGATLVTGQIALATPLVVRGMEVDSGRAETDLQPLTLTGDLHLINGGVMNIGAGAIIGGDTHIEMGELHVGTSTALSERSIGESVDFLGELFVSGEFRAFNSNVNFHGAVVVSNGVFDVFGSGFALRFSPAGIQVPDGDLFLSGSPEGGLLIGSIGVMPHVFEVTTPNAVALEYLVVENSNADSGMPLVPLFSTDLGGNTQWFFGSPLLGFTLPPVDTPVGETMPAIEVAIIDALGNVIPEFNGNIEIALLNNPTNAVLKGPSLNTSTMDGIATFAGLSLDRLGTDFTLRAIGTSIERDVGGEGSAQSTFATVSPPFNTMTCGYGVWFMDGTVFDANAIIPFVLDEGEVIQTIGDFDGDGKADIFTDNDDTLESWFWFMNGSRVTAREELLDPARVEVPSSVVVVGAGDFNHDGRDELLKRDLTTGDIHLVVVNGHVVQDQLTLPAEPDTDLKVVGTGDLDIDGNIDILWQNTQTGTISVWFMNGTTRSGDPATINVTLPAGTEVVGIGDFNADGGADLVVRTSSAAREADLQPATEVWIMNGLDMDSIVTLPSMPDRNDHVVDVGDFDDDDGADILWRYCTALSRDFAENNAVALHPPPAAVVRSDDVVEIGVEGLPTAMTWMPMFDNAERAVTDGLRYELFVSQDLTTLGNYLDFLNDIADSGVMDADGSMFFEFDGELTQLFDIFEVNEVREEISPGVFEMIFDYGVIFDQDAADGSIYKVDPVNESFPVFGVTWEGAAMYCNWLSWQKGLTFDDFAYTMDDGGCRPRHLSPSDWADGFDADERREWLARYPFAYRMPMDNQSVGSDPFNEYYAYAAGPNEDAVGSPRGGNFWGSGDFFEPGPTSTGYFGTNDVGVSDAVGNAWEWMSDTFVSGDTSTWAVRGGSWYNHRELLTTTQRFPVVNTAFADVSFRVVCGADAVFQIRVDEMVDTSEGPQASYDHEYDWSGSRIFSPKLTESTEYEWNFRVIHPGLSTVVPSWPESAREASETFTTTDQVAKNIIIDLAEDWNLLALDNDPTQRHPKFQFGFPTTAWGWSNESQQYFKLFETVAFDGFWVHMDHAQLDFEIAGFTPASSIYQAATGWNLFGPLDHDSVLERDRSNFRGVVFYYDSFADSPGYIETEEIQLEDSILGDGVVPQGIILKHQLAHWLFTIEPFEIDFSVLSEPAEVRLTTTTTATTTTTLAGDGD